MFQHGWPSAYFECRPKERPPLCRHRWVADGPAGPKYLFTVSIFLRKKDKQNACTKWSCLKPNQPRITGFICKGNGKRLSETHRHYSLLGGKIKDMVYSEWKSLWWSDARYAMATEWIAWNRICITNVNTTLHLCRA